MCSGQYQDGYPLHFPCNDSVVCQYRGSPSQCTEGAYLELVLVNTFSNYLRNQGAYGGRSNCFLQEHWRWFGIVLYATESTSRFRSASLSLMINMWINNRLFHCIELAINQGTMTEEEAEAFGKCLRALVNNFAV